MDTVFLLLTCCLSLAFTEPTTENGLMNLRKTSTETGKDVIVNSTNGPSLTSFEYLTINTTLITATTLISAAEKNGNLTASTPTTATASSHSPTSESTTAVPFTNRTQSTVVTTGTQTETFVPHAEQTTKDSQTTSSVTTAKSSAVNATSQSVQTTQGVRLSVSEKILTITFSVMLGCFALAVVAIKLHRFTYKLHFSHPLNNTNDWNVSTENPYTPLGSGRLGHPIYDHVPPDRQDDAPCHMEFLH